MNLTSDELLRREHVSLRLRRAGALGDEHPSIPPAPAAGSDVLADAHAAGSFGVAFSGGGIRSATFNLGVLQGLSEKGLLKYVDVLSTVSGGGYIGSWLHALIRNHDDGRPVATEAKLAASVTAPPGTPENDPVMFLRAYSNYLAPRPGLFSSDSWTVGVIWLRNVLLNQLILAPAVAALIAAALAGIFLNQTASATWLTAIVAAVALLAATILLVLNLAPIARRSVESEPADGVIAPPAQGAGPEGSRDGIRIVFLVVAAAIALGTVQVTLAGWPLRLMVAIPILLMVLIQVGGGFIGCYAARHGSRVPAVAHVVWMSIVSGAVAAAMLAGVWILVAGWQDRPWLIVICGPALMILAVLASNMLLVGLMGADYPDAAREWTARIGARLGIAAAAWAALLALAILGPWGVSQLLVEFRTIGIGAVAAWAATAIGGAMAGSSAKTDGAGKDGAGKRVLEMLTSVAPTVFLIGYVILVATGVHRLLDAIVPPATRPAIALAPTRYDVTVETPDPAAIDVRVERSESGWLAEALAPVDAFERGYPSRLTDGPVDRLVASAIALGLFAIIAFVASARININEFSLHHFYKNRLVRCYLGASNRRRQANSFTGFDPRDDFPLSFLTPTPARPDGKPKPPYYGPYAIVNTALNLNTGSELAQQERKATSFVFTPHVCGFDPFTREQVQALPGAGPSPLGYRPTWGYANAHGPNLGTTMAISGAAANPNWGYHTSGPVAFLLTVFNARLGWWLGNPRWPKASAKDGPTLALKYLFAELLGQTTNRTSFVNLSDGGHFENLGLYELVRRRTRFIIVCDAEEDGGLTFGSLGGVVRKCRADFGVEIDIDPAPIRRGPDGSSGAHCVVGTITYPELEPAFAARLTGGVQALGTGRVPRARGWLLYLKSSLTGDEPADVIEYQAAHPEFPHESTGDQFFSESQFESYRRLGLHVLRSAFDGVDVTPGRAESGSDVALAARYPLIGIFQALARRWYAPIPVTAEAATRLADAYVETMRRLAATPGLAPLYEELVSSTPPPPSRMTPEMLAFGMELLQLMQNVFTEFKLEGAFNQANPRNSGWIQVFNKWLESDLFYGQIWPRLRNDYHAIFRQFVDDLHAHGVPDVPGRL